MKLAITNHAVDRYAERVEGAKGFFRESVREQIRKIVEDGFAEGLVREHPLDRKRRIIPFRSGGDVLYLSLGPNKTDREADIAVVSVLFEKELSEGKTGVGVTLGDLFPEATLIPLPKKPRYVMFIGDPEITIEKYVALDEIALRALVNQRRPKPEETSIYQLID